MSPANLIFDPPVFDQLKIHCLKISFFLERKIILETE